MGRAYALLLARGAKVVVNDPGVSMKGNDMDAGPAQGRGGGNSERPVARRSPAPESVATLAGGQAIIDAALNAYGRIDILIHNAGPCARAAEGDDDTGGFRYRTRRSPARRVPRRAPGIRADVRGRLRRVVLTTSIGGLYGSCNQANYCAARAGWIGLSNVIALEVPRKA
ncbi:MAG: hypothetical protein IPG64_08805 [Haliea sp.]|nr:hypothetical protein [Haliea sp.]